MKFCIAAITFWHSVGFDTTNWRTSTDGTRALCHEKFAATLVDVEDNPRVECYGIDSEEFRNLIEEEFTDFAEQSEEEAE